MAFGWLASIMQQNRNTLKPGELCRITGKQVLQYYILKWWLNYKLFILYGFITTDTGIAKFIINILTAVFWYCVTLMLGTNRAKQFFIKLEKNFSVSSAGDQLELQENM